MILFSNVLAGVSLAALVLGFAIVVGHVAWRQTALIRTRRLNPFSLSDALDVLGGRHHPPGAPSFFQTRHGRWSLWLMVGGLFGLLAAAALFIIA
ncbi:hypothetical protein [Pelagibacterium lacus]|uniref:Uncharacterized protein n=1 Tax=Pelagibacterium lacus TaxID=2282655 RepID=A0A369W858_9HYPH|nr:hypothetical protein [Pelagibacterium lacus]RDE09442.1 hypothetical protein DVH29_06455 [Pelagibacterium lacus]